MDEDYKKNRFRLFICILYEDAKNYDFTDVLRNLKSFKKYAYIQHKPEKDEKKAHYHFLLKSDNAMTIEALSKKTGLPKNYIQNVINERSMCRYLVHQDDEDKIQYNLEDVNVSKLYKNYFLRCFDDLEDEEEIIYKIFCKLSEIAKLPRQQQLISLTMFLNINSYHTIYHRYQKEFESYLHYEM